MHIEQTLSDFKGKIDRYFKTQFEEIPSVSSEAGRKIYILKRQKNQFEKYLAKKDKSFAERYFFNQILSLRNVGYLSSQFSAVSPILRRLTLEGGEIVYAVWNGNSYITQINTRPADTKKPAAGVYSVKNETKQKKPEAWKAHTEVELSSLQEKNLAIHGFAANAQRAAEYMPAFIEYGFGERNLEYAYDLFYNPSTSRLKSEWRSLKDDIGAHTQTAKKLAEVLVLTARKKQEVNITVHEDGHLLLKSALQLVAQTGQSLQNFTVFYANPTSNLQSIDKLRMQTQIKLAEKPPLLNTLSLRQYITSGNFVSEAGVSSQISRANGISSGFNAIATTLGFVALGTASTNILGVIGVAATALPLALSQSRTMNQKVITSAAASLQEGSIHLAKKTKLVWDPIHKMMVRE